MTTSPWVWIFFALGFLALPNSEDDRVVCKKCDSTGMRECKAHEKDACALEDGRIFCTEFHDCELCSGLGWVDCEKCDNPASDEARSDRIAERAAKYEKHAWIQEPMGRKVRFAESEHFRLVWELDSLKVNKKRLDGHQLLHLYAERLDKLYEDYMETLGAGSKYVKEKPLVLVWGLQSDQIKASVAYCNMSSSRGCKLLGSDPRYSTCGNRQVARNDDALHRNLVHNVVHLLLSHQSPSIWIGNIKGGWADAGLAHWFEDRYWGICTNYCYQEQNTMVDFKGGKYKVAIRKLVATDKVPPSATVFQKNTDTLTPVEHAVSFSYVDYLLSIDGSKFAKLVQMLKKRKPTRDALQTAYELNPIQFEEQWKAWVLETYPKR